MADIGTTQSIDPWPLVRFAFSVKIGDLEGLFQEVNGLSSETQQIEYRAGNSPAFSTVKMPGLQKFGNITLKKGLFKDDKALWDIQKKMKMNVIERKTIFISLLDERGDVAMSWSLSNAFPVKFTITDMKTEANEAAIETMELAHEGLTIL